MSQDQEANGEPAATPTVHAGDATVMLELVREMRAQRESTVQAEARAHKERQSERRWRMLFQALFFGAPVLFGITYLMIFLNSAGFRWGPFGDVVGVVRIEGPIGANERASADAIVPALRKAFVNPNVKAVVLSIDSPGGAPVEAERIYRALEDFKKAHPKPVTAVINNIGASAAYLVAIHADEIVAGKYSLVGSIGAIIAPWRLDRAAARFDVSQRVYASGRLKSFLNPFTPITPEVDAKAQHLVDELGGVFLAELKTARAKPLQPGVDFGTGEVWSGTEAKALGLVDAVDTVDAYVGKRWPGLQSYDFGPSGGSGQFFGRALEDLVVGAVQRVLANGAALPLR